MTERGDVMSRISVPLGMSGRLVVTFGLLVVLSLGVLGFLLISESQEAVSTSVSRDQKEIAIQAAERVEALVKEPMHHLSVSAGVLGMLGSDPWKQESVLIRLKARFPVFSTIVLTDKAGRGVVTTDTGLSPGDWSEEKAFQAAIHGEAFISPVLYSDVEGPFTHMAVPVMLRGKPVGTLCAKVNLRGVWDLVDSIRVGSTGAVCVVSQDGVVVASADKRDALQGRELGGLADHGDTCQSQEYVDASGSRWLRAYAPIRGVGWGILLEQSAREGYAFGRKMRRDSLLVVLLGVALSLGAAIANSRSVVRPIRKLAEATVRITQGDLDYTVDCDRSDEVGQFARSFNEMTHSLKRTQRELLAEKAFVDHILEHSPIGILTLDSQRHVTSANTSVARLMGEEATVIGRHISEIPFLESLGLADFIEGQEAEHIVSVGLNRDVRGYCVRKSLLNESAAETWIVLIDDITERSRAEAALQRSLEEADRARRLLLALSGAGQAAQQARTPEQVYEALSRGAAQAGLSAAVLTLTDDREHLIWSHPGFAPELIRAAEELTGLPVQGYRFPLHPQGFFKRVIQEEEALLVERPLKLVREALPEAIHSLASRVAKLLGITKCILAPLSMGSGKQGMLAVVGSGLSQADVPAITTFANQAAIALENARLLRQTRMGRRDLQRLSARLVDAQEAERKRISRELHDQLGQAMTAMKINLDEMEATLGSALDPADRKRLTETRELLRTTIAQVRELALDLRPGILDDLGIVPALDWYADRWSQRLKIKARFEASDLEERLPGDVETALYRTAQEALTNVGKHANATEVRIRLERKTSAVSLCVEDDGQGFNTESLATKPPQQRGLGLLGMQERVGFLHGGLSVQSSPGKGTRLCIEIPLRGRDE